MRRGCLAQMIFLLGLAGALAGCGSGEAGPACTQTNTCRLPLAWDYADDPSRITGFRLYWGPVSRTEGGFSGYPNHAETTELTKTVEGLGNQTYYFSVVAYRYDTEGPYSEELTVYPNDLTAAATGPRSLSGSSGNE